jgi:heme/copper-type cytochrome/quinol oxidase subunit 2
MQIKVIVETQEEFDAWMAEQDTFKTLVSAQ